MARPMLLSFPLILLGTLSITCAATTGTPSANGVVTTNTAVFAGGCFWWVEKDFDQVPGVQRTTSGYTGGHTKNPTYKTVTGGGTGHFEAVEIEFDPEKVSYAELVEIFWRSVDPTDGGGQFCDRGASYRTAIFPRTPQQRRLTESSKAKLDDSKVLKRPVVTPVLDAGAFYPAEDYHQDYYQKNPGRYAFYRFRCGRDRRLKNLWGEHAHRGIAY